MLNVFETSLRSNPLAASMALRPKIAFKPGPTIAQRGSTLQKCWHDCVPTDLPTVKVGLKKSQSLTSTSCVVPCTRNLSGLKQSPPYRRLRERAARALRRGTAERKNIPQMLRQGTERRRKKPPQCIRDTPLRRHAQILECRKGPSMSGQSILQAATHLQLFTSGELQRSSGRGSSMPSRTSLRSARTSGPGARRHRWG